MASSTVEAHITADYERCTKGAKAAYDFCKSQPVVQAPPQPWYWSWWPAPATCGDKFSARVTSCMETMISRQERLLKAKAPVTKITQTNNQSNDSSRTQTRIDK